MWLIGKRQNQYNTHVTEGCAPLRTQVPPTSPTHCWVIVCLFLGYQNQIHAYTSSIERYFLFALYMSYLVQEYEDTSWHVRVCILLALITY